MQSVLTAKSAVLVHLKSVGVVFLVFLGVIVPLLTDRTGKCDLVSHFDGTSRLDLANVVEMVQTLHRRLYLPRRRIFFARKKSPPQR